MDRERVEKVDTCLLANPPTEDLLVALRTRSAALFPALLTILKNIFFY